MPSSNNRNPRRLWTSAEDALLQEGVEKYGACEWEKIAAMVRTRVDWQCRERWNNHLKPGVQKRPWQAWEDQLIETHVRDHGHTWATLARSLPGRSTTAVKNRFHQLCRSRRRTSPPQLATASTIGGLPMPMAIPSHPMSVRPSHEATPKSSFVTPPLATRVAHLEGPILAVPDVMSMTALLQRSQQHAASQASLHPADVWFMQQFPANAHLLHVDAEHKASAT
mmetsp:Transcript_850/g.2356  ORF Transcript_850/g.2356 Transcript_850/m.2356 type:complete len:224 (-) Transcript_850:668-1339(-)